MAKKKIFDITPPEKAKEFLGQQKATKAKEPAVKKLIAKKSLNIRGNFRFKKPVLIAVGILLICLLCFIFIKPEAEIEIWPVKETVEFKTQFSPTGEIIEQSHSTTQEFVSTGKTTKAEKAEGVIKVYNNYHLSQILVANTRFWCFEKDELREFKTKVRVVIPSQESLDVAVKASSAGEEYNIDPCTFSIPGLKGSPRYTAVYGKSSSPMTGGSKSEVTQVSQEDLDKAEEITTEKALADAKASLENLISKDEYILTEEAIETKIIEANPITEVGQKVDNFIFQVKVEATALVFKKTEMEEFAKTHLLSQIPQGKEMVEGSLAVGYLPRTVNLAEREMVLELEITAEIYSGLDESSIKENLKNLGPSEVAPALRKFSEIDRAQARLWPFWVGAIPSDAEKIKIKLNLD